jgi:hypothetical protein
MLSIKPRQKRYIKVQIDEVYSFVNQKSKKVWIFYVYAPETKEIGDPSSFAQGLIAKIVIFYFVISGISQGRLLPQKVDALKGISLTQADEEKFYIYKELCKLHYIKPNT